MAYDSEKLTEALDGIKAGFEGDLKSAVEAEAAERKALGTVSAETAAKTEKIQDALDALEAEVKSLRVGRTERDAEDDAPNERKAAFGSWLRKGALDTKALQVSDDTEGGVFAPVEFVNDLVKGLIEYSPIRSIANVRQTSARAIATPKRTGVLAASWTGEVETRTETTGTAFGLDEIPTHEQYAMVDVSRTDLDDAQFSLESYLMDEIREQFAVAEATAFVSGNGVKKPHGFLNNTEIEQIFSGSASDVTADGLIDLIYALKEGYAPNATFVMKRATIRNIRKLKIIATGEYVWQPGLVADRPGTILGAPYVEATDMPAIAGAAVPVAYGDFRKGYTIVDRMEMNFLRDPYTQAATGTVRFHAWKRVGGQVRLPEAIKTQDIATS
jgi:HK97 family phage major capsid protein